MNGAVVHTHAQEVGKFYVSILASRYLQRRITKGRVTQAIFVATTQYNFYRAEVATSKSHVQTGWDFSAIFGNLSPRYEIQLTKHGEFE